MTPSEKASLLLALCNALEPLDSREQDIVFRCFKINAPNRWNYNGDYVSDILCDCDIPTLLGLAEHFRIGTDRGGIAVAFPDCWNDQGLRVFISHSSANKAEAKALSDLLLPYGIKGFVAHEDIEPNRDWIEQIKRALFTCDVLIALVTADFKTSSWTNQEVGFVYARRQLIVAVRIPDDPRGLLATTQALTSHAVDGACASQLLDIFTEDARTQARFTTALCEALAQSTSYRQAIDVSKRLEGRTGLTREQVAIIESSLSNGQVARAIGVAGRVSKIVQNARESAGGTDLPRRSTREGDAH